MNKTGNKKSRSLKKRSPKKGIKEFKEGLPFHRDKLNLNLVMAEQGEKNLRFLGTILNDLAAIKKLCDEFDQPLFSNAISKIRGIVSAMVVDEVEYKIGLRKILKLHKILEDAFEGFLSNSLLPESFEKDFNLEPMVQTSRKKEEDINNKAVLQKLDKTADTSSLPLFITDSLESVEKVQARLLDLENDPENIELVNSIFRCFHSIKGAAGFLGLPAILKLTHNAETALDDVRHKRLKVTSDLINCLLEVRDAIQRLLIQLKELNDPSLDDSQISHVNIEKAENLLGNFLSDSNSSKIPSLANQSVVDKMQKPKSVFGKGQNIEKDKSLILDVVRVPSEKLDELSELVGELVIALSILSHNEIITGIEDREVRDKLNQMEKTTESLRNKTLEVRMVPLEPVFSRLARQVRDLSQKLNKKVKLTTKGKDTLVDKLVIDEIYSPLMHIVRNALDHGLESEKERIASGKPAVGNITLSAYHQGESIRIEIRDDGKGLNKEKVLEKAKQAGIVKEDIALSDDQIFGFIFHAGFSTADKVTNVSGRGVGMDVVKKTMEKLRGKIKVSSKPGKGSVFSLQLPMTTSIIEGLVFRIGETKFIAPLLSVRQTVTPRKDELQSIHDREGQCFLYQGKLLPILKLYEYFQIEPSIKDPSKAMIIIVGNGQESFGLMVDELLHKQQVVIKNVKDRFNDLKGISGGTILGSGQVGFILDPDEIVQQMEK